MEPTLTCTRCLFCVKDPCICGDCTPEQAPKLIKQIIWKGEYERALGLYRKFKDVLDDEVVGNALGDCDHDEGECDYHDLLAEVNYFPTGESPDECTVCQENFKYGDSVVYYIKSGKFQLAHHLLRLHEGRSNVPTKRILSALADHHDKDDSHWHEFVEFLAMGWGDLLQDTKCDLCYGVRERKGNPPCDSEDDE